jgi:hypothetical protein
MTRCLLRGLELGTWGRTFGEYAGLDSNEEWCKQRPQLTVDTSTSTFLY